MKLKLKAIQLFQFVGFNLQRLHELEYCTFMSCLPYSSNWNRFNSIAVTASFDLSVVNFGFIHFPLLTDCEQNRIIYFDRIVFLFTFLFLIVFCFGFYLFFLTIINFVNLFFF